MNGPSEFHVIGSIRDWQAKDRLGEIGLPTLIVSGRHDEAITPVGEPRDVHVLVRQRGGVNVAPADGQPHCRGDAPLIPAPRLLVHRRLRSAGQREPIADVIPEAEPPLVAPAGAGSVGPEHLLQLEIAHVPVIVAIAGVYHHRGRRNVARAAGVIEHALDDGHLRLGIAGTLTMKLEGARSDVDDRGRIAEQPTPVRRPDRQIAQPGHREVGKTIGRRYRHRRLRTRAIAGDRVFAPQGPGTGECQHALYE